jgi:ParB family chromosome partitioning protein
MVRKIRYKDIPDSYNQLVAPRQDDRMRVSVGLENSIKEYFYLNISDLKPYHKQARKNFHEDEINKLAETIKEYGVRQPLTVSKSAVQGQFEVISGERRLRAAKIAGLEKVPCIIMDDDKHIEEIALIENIQRSDLHPIELSHAYTSLLENYHFGDQTKLAEKLGVSKSQMSESLRYGTLPDEIKDYLLKNNIRARSTLRDLLRCSSIDAMKKFLGMEKGDIVSGKRRFIANIFIKNGQVECELTSLNLTFEQKLHLKDTLLKIIKSIDSSEESN